MSSTVRVYQHTSGCKLLVVRDLGLSVFVRVLPGRAQLNVPQLQLTEIAFAAAIGLESKCHEEFKEMARSRGSELERPASLAHPGPDQLPRSPGNFIRAPLQRGYPVTCRFSIEPPLTVMIWERRRAMLRPQ